MASTSKSTYCIYLISYKLCKIEVKLYSFYLIAFLAVNLISFLLVGMQESFLKPAFAFLANYLNDYN